MADSEFCGQGWQEQFVDVIESARTNLLLCSPYVSQYGCDVVIAHLSSQRRNSGRVTVITDLSPEAICQGSTEPDAIRSIAAQVPTLGVRHLPRLHAKVYVADSRMAIVTSGNLTAGGLRQNYEYGIQLCEPRAVARIRDDVSAYGELGAHIEKDQLAEYSEIARAVRSSYVRARRSIATDVRRRFQAALRRAEDELVRLRLAGGAMHTVFARTILYLLRRLGPLTTTELHSRIEAIHPDLCDNTVDRVIEGKRFGKKWKHAVRTAQQQLKKRGLIDLNKDCWHALDAMEESGAPSAGSV